METWLFTFGQLTLDKLYSLYNLNYKIDFNYKNRYLEVVVPYTKEKEFKTVLGI